MTIKDLSKIRVLIVDDQKFVQEMLKSYLASDPTIQVVATADNGQSGLELIETYMPDIALVDIEMPGLDGLATAQAIVQRFPDTKVLVLSGYDDFEYLHRALQIGVKGYLDKATPAAELIEGIHSIHKGYFQLGPGLLEKVLQTIAVQNVEETDPSIHDIGDRLRVVEVLSGQSLERDKVLQQQVKELQLKFHSHNYEWMNDKCSDFEQQLTSVFARIYTLEKATRKLWLMVVVIALLCIFSLIVQLM